jgi:hypothetical protein
MKNFNLLVETGGINQLIFKENNIISIVIWFDKINIDGDDFISLWHNDNYVALVSIFENQRLYDELIKLPKIKRPPAGRAKT